ncbi:MAG TPA: type II toxin-antitoxin system HipA family toxin [Pseudomonadales bacterium]|nr:type II toxin-antitoxin system HipA family toxin [Pseudomonadales bacterium]
MERRLDVYLHRHLVGKLIQSQHGAMAFAYDGNWLANPDAVPLSHSLPLRKERFPARECSGYFAGILPEENKRILVAKNLGISAENDFAMLEKIGGECAGAVTFVVEGKKLLEHEHSYRPLAPDALAKILRELPRRPLMAGEAGIRLSLAGAQDKIAVHYSNGQISVPLDSSPSTHILKPAIENFEGVVFNEAFCMKLAQAIGIKTAKVEIRRVEGIDYLLVERYDRTVLQPDPGGSEYLRREHQEDFCQALGIVSKKKYQKEGGPSLEQCFGLVREVSTSPVIDLQTLLDAVIFNFIIGNNDAHGKNFSLLYTGETELGRKTSLAPQYDVLSTAYYPELSNEMAMKIGDEYETNKVHVRDFERFADTAVLAKPSVRRRVSELAQMAMDKANEVKWENSVVLGVAKLIQVRCERILVEFKG